MSKSNTAYRLHAIRVILDRVSQSRFWGMGIFITISIALVASSVLLVNFVNFTETNLLSTEKQPLASPILLCVILVSFYLALQISLNVSREYDNSTIEMLLYGPVDEISYILGNFFAQIKVFLVTLVIILIWTNLTVWLLNLDFRSDVFLMLLAATFMCGEVVAFGLLVAAWGGKRRSALVYFLIIILVIGGIQAADVVVSTLVQVQESTANDPLVVVRNALTSLSSVMGWVSPYSQLDLAFESVLNNSSGGFLLSLGLMTVEMVLMLFGSISLLKRKGVRG